MYLFSVLFSVPASRTRLSFSPLYVKRSRALMFSAPHLTIFLLYLPPLGTPFSSPGVLPLPPFERYFTRTTIVN